MAENRSEKPKSGTKAVWRFPIRNVEIADVRPQFALGWLCRNFTANSTDGLCFLGQHYIEKMTGAPARMGAVLMEKDRFMVGCEGDIGGLVMMDLLRIHRQSAISGGMGQFDRANNAVPARPGIGAPGGKKR